MPAITPLVLAGLTFYASQLTTVQHATQCARLRARMAPEELVAETNPLETEPETKTSLHTQPGEWASDYGTLEKAAVTDPFYNLGFHERMVQLEAKLRAETLAARTEASELKRETQNLKVQLVQTSLEAKAKLDAAAAEVAAAQAQLAETTETASAQVEEATQAAASAQAEASAATTEVANLRTQLKETRSAKEQLTETAGSASARVEEATAAATTARAEARAAKAEAAKLRGQLATATAKSEAVSAKLEALEAEVYKKAHPWPEDIIVATAPTAEHHDAATAFYVERHERREWPSVSGGGGAPGDSTLRQRAVVSTRGPPPHPPADVWDGPGHDQSAQARRAARLASERDGMPRWHTTAPIARERSRGESWSRGVQMSPLSAGLRSRADAPHGAYHAARSLP